MFVVTSRMASKRNHNIHIDKTADIRSKTKEYVTLATSFFKDVLGANRSEYGTSVLVAPYGNGDDRLVRYLQRPLEAAIRPAIGSP